MWLVIAVSVAAGVYVAKHWPAAALPYGRSLVIAGVVLFVAGLLLRWWAIIALGRFFTVDVAIEKDHELVEREPFRMVKRVGERVATSVSALRTAHATASLGIAYVRDRRLIRSLSAFSLANEDQVNENA